MEETSASGETRKSTESPEKIVNVVDVDSSTTATCQIPIGTNNGASKKDEAKEDRRGSSSSSECSSVDASPAYKTDFPNLLDADCSKLIEPLTSWEWVTIDGLQLPAVTKHQERYVSVHMVQLKLLSKFPPHVPSEIIRKFTMDSHKMTEAEAWKFNSINAVLRKFDLGCHIFSANDELVKLNDVQMFYWNVKLINLKRIRSQYESMLHDSKDNLELLAIVKTLKTQVENDIDAVDAELHRREKENPRSTTQNEEAVSFSK